MDKDRQICEIEQEKIQDKAVVTIAEVGPRQKVQAFRGGPRQAYLII
jgi:hypothetical protein